VVQVAVTVQAEVAELTEVMGQPMYSYHLAILVLVVVAVELALQ
jgi:hypothetical protein